MDEPGELNAAQAARLERLLEEFEDLVRDAFREGRLSGQELVTNALSGYLDEIYKETEEAYENLTPEAIANFEAAHKDEHPSPALGARFGAMGDLMMRIKARIAKLTPSSVPPTPDR